MIFTAGIFSSCRQYHEEQRVLVFSKVVKYYHENIYPNLNQNPTYDEVMAEKDYYTWLYNEFNMRDRHKKHVVSNQTTDETDSTD